MNSRLSELNTPCYILDHDEFIRNIRNIQACFSKEWDNDVILGYSVKTNHFRRLLEIALENGLWAETVSQEEYDYAIRTGFTADKIIYNGPQKKANLKEAFDGGSIINVDNFADAGRVIEYSRGQSGYRIGIRVNFDLEKECPGETTVGNDIGRFGVCFENGDLGRLIKRFREEHVSINGLHMHTSSRTRSLDIYRALCRKADEIIDLYDLYDMDYIDIGGGMFGGNFFTGKPKVSEYAKTICGALKECRAASGLNLIIEPGAVILATSMDYLVSVSNIRDIRGTRVITVDGTCTHVNPFLKHRQQTPCSLINPGGDMDEEQVIGGSSCMEMDRFYPMNLTQRIEEDTRLLFHCAGAYAMCHNSCFINTPPCIYEKRADGYTLIRDKKTELMDF